MPIDRETGAHLGVGAFQAALAFGLYQSSASHAWPATEAVAFFPICMVMVLAPLSFYASSAAPLARRVGLMLVVALLAAAIGVYQGLTIGALSSSARLADRPGGYGADEYLLPTLLLALVVLVAVPAAAIANRWRVRYEPWVDALLHNTLLLLQGLLVTGLFWLVLFSAGALFRMVRLPFLSDLIEQPWFWIPVTALVFSYGVSLAVKNRTVARFLFDRLTQLCGWIYPLAGLLGMAFVLSWTVQGIEPLLDTRNAAFLLLWFSVLCVLLVNASSRGGLDAPRYPRWLRRTLSTGMLVLLPMVAVALYGLALRIGQYGWTVDRLWGFFVALMVGVFALGYAANAVLEWAGRPERCLVPATNAVAAVLLAMGVLLLVSGVVDPRRVSVNDQLHRMARGQGGDDNQIRYLARAGGIFGRRALEAMAAEPPPDGVPARRVALARDALMSVPQRLRHQAGLVRSLPLFPVGTVAPDVLLKALGDGDTLAGCAADTCLLWRLPDGLAERAAFVVLARTVDADRSGGVGRVWVVDAQGAWRVRGQLSATGLDGACQRKPGTAATLFDAVRAGEAAPMPKPQRDIGAGGLRFPLTLWSATPCE